MTALPALARSRFIALAAVSVLFGSALLSLNFANEYAAYGGSRSLPELPSVHSMIENLGANDHERHPYATLDNVLRQALHRAGVASAPYAVAELASDALPPLSLASPTTFWWSTWGAASACWALAAIALIPRRFRVPMASFVLMGFCWSLAARHNTHDVAHSYEGLFFYGLPMALWLAALIGARRLLGARLGGALAIGTAALAAALFTLSALDAARIRTDADAAKRAKEIMADMDAVRKIADGKGVAFHRDAKVLTRNFDFFGLSHYYLAGSYHQGDGASADYALSRYRDESLGLLTPGNRRLFLYESAGADELYRAERRRLESSPPDAESHFDLYLEGGELAYLRSPCVPEADADDGDPFFLRVYPVGAGEPSEYSESRFRFSSRGGAAFDDACMTSVDLPSDYPIAAVQTGQRAADGALIWQAAVFPPPSAETLSAYESDYQAVADGGEPAARSSGFDLHLDADGGTLSYLKQPCTEDGVRGRFYLSVYPADAGDLPASRRGLGHESLNFDFISSLGAAFNGKCMATIRLPDYEIAKMETGQDAPGAGRLWEVSVSPPPSAETVAAYERAYAAIAASTPAAQSGFDLHLTEDALTYLKQPCSQDDVRGRFWLSVHPADIGDLPASRREIRRESLDFDFVPPHGVVFNGKCMASVQLPDYEIAKIETGQDAAGGGRLWSATVEVGD